MTRRKLYLSFYDLLNEPERSQAKENLSLCHNKVDENDNFSECIMRGFIWAETPQGHDYWSEIDDLVQEGKYKTNKNL